jgi:hypothetical protein
MNWRLLVDLEVVAFLDALRPSARRRIPDHFQRIRSAPSQSSDYQEQDETGRTVDISVQPGLAVHYWIDHADPHIKVLAIHPADR